MVVVYTAAEMDSSSKSHIADAAPGNWVERALPAAALPYAQLMRLDRPIGWWLLLIPCWWGLALAASRHGVDSRLFWYAGLLLLGSIVMRGAGCVLNDIMDRDIDARVARTRLRPLPSGRVSKRSATAFMSALMLVGFAVLLQFNAVTIWTGLASLAIVAVYPLMKRITHWPQAVLGLAFNWGALVGWTAVSGGIAAPAILLYVGGACWTLAYDTIYAHQDKEDDALIGVKSTALKFGAHTLPWLKLFFALALAAIAAAMWLTPVHPVAFAGLLAAAAHAGWQLHHFDGNNSASCLKLFRSNRTFGLLILAGLLIGLFIK
jgi:4-hydroxybenzoate polyprenyltransferase